VQSMFSFGHLCKVLPGKHISIVLDSGIVKKLHWLFGRGCLLGRSVLRARRFVNSAALCTSPLFCLRHAKPTSYIDCCYRYHRPINSSMVITGVHMTRGRIECAALGR
jgi:hypothetical protein